MHQVEIKDVSKSFGWINAVADCNISVREGEFFSLLGPSGCGKTTTLRMLAGFVPPSTGQILLQGEDVTRLPPERRNIGIVFQNYAVFPHMTVAGNVGYGLKLRKKPKSEINRRVREALVQVDLNGYEDRTPNELSGGEQQRVALARVIVLEPRLLLLDEPLSALDKRLRDEMRVWLKQLQSDLGITTIYVTHDQDEALSLSDRLAVMKDGRVQQIGTPLEVYEEPSNRFVANFIGESNFLAARIVGADETHIQVELEGGGTCLTPRQKGIAVESGMPITVMVRPERVRMHTPDSSAFNRFPGELETASFHGSIIRFRAKLSAGFSVQGEFSNLGREDLREGQPVTIGWHRDHSVLFLESD